VNAPDPRSESAVRIEEHFDRSQADLWAAITDSDRLSRWLGGRCSIDSRVGGEVQFDLPEDGITAHGTVRSCDPPTAGFRVALLEHTFVDDAAPAVTSVCRWAVIQNVEGGCDLHFTHDGFGEADRDKLTTAWPRRLGAAAVPSAVDRPGVSTAAPADVLAAARRVLLVSFIGPEVPVTLASAGFDVVAKTGPGPDDWASCRAAGGELVTTPLSRPPDHVDLVHLDIAHAFDDYVELAARLGASTVWYHSARTRPPEPADNRGTWVPAPQSARQRQIVEASGMTYIDDHYIADVARQITERAR
jgi:uncharacterized protein YndB with AHSA1/START domain